MSRGSLDSISAFLRPCAFLAKIFDGYITSSKVSGDVDEEIIAE